MFDFLNRIFEWLFQFVPQFQILSPAESGVRITCIPFVKKWYSLKGFGWYMYWPLFQSFLSANVKPQILVVEVVRDGPSGKATVTTWGVQFWIRDIAKALFESEDHEERLASHTAKVIGEYVEKGEKVDDAALSSIRNSMSGLGIYIQYTTSKSIKLFLENAAERLGRVVG
jgi:hypothetical protein